MKQKIRTPKGEGKAEKIIIIVFAVLAVIIGAVVLVMNFNPARPDVDGELPSIGTETDEDGNKVEIDASQYVRREGVYNFLLVGYDKAAGLTDVNMIAQFDVDTGKVSIVQIPRDTYARYNEKGSYKKVNGAFGHFKRDLESLANFFEKIFCIQIDFYASIDLRAFRNIVNIIGGVPMYVPRDMFYEDPDQDLYINLKKGYQTLNGDQAEQFVRFRKGYVQADIGRTDAQKLFMTAFVKQFQKKVNVSTLVQIGNQMLKYAKTNMGINDFVFFAKAVLDADLSNMTMLTVPGKSIREFETSGSYYWVISHDSMLDIVNTYLNVFSRDITPEMFDSEKLLTNPESAYMNKVYNTPIDIDVYQGDKVDQNGIVIPGTK